jgi:hypothetical protein
VFNDHQTFIPPSTTISTPVKYELSSEASRADWRPRVDHANRF